MSTVNNYCPGWYCGREYLETGELSECGACPRGFRRNDTTYICELCQDTPLFYDWLYLGFVVLVVVILHWFFIDMVAKMQNFSNSSKGILVLHFTALFEVIVAGVVAVLLVSPMGVFAIRSCRVDTLADWYTLLHNPTPNYEEKIYCTQEAVYPLYTIVFIFYALCLGVMLLIRPWICRKCYPRRSKMSIYAAMYFIPILTIMHALIGGLLYYAFPYLVVIISVISCAAHFAVRLDQRMKSLVKSTFSDTRNAIILIGHWCLHAYGIIAITELSNPTLHALMILLVPLPALFYICTAKFTDPNKFQI